MSSENPALILVQLKFLKSNETPTIANVKDIRIKKIQKQTLSLIKQIFGQKQKVPNIQIIDSYPAQNNINIRVDETDKLKVFCSPNNVDKILPFVNKKYQHSQVDLVDFSATV
ncbi:MAG TPA: hypothetical protein VFQ86_11315 [Arachidicoccus soli]|nr:hypothetical protein [Arachidicoccus soli]